LLAQLALALRAGGGVPAPIDVHLHHIGHEAEMRAVVGLVVAAIAANVVVAAVEALEHLKTEDVGARARAHLAAELLDDVVRDLAGRRVAGRNDRRVALEHEALATRRVARELEERLDLLGLELL